MRHGKKINHLSRTASHRKALLKNMAIALIEHKRINTTVAKAKALRRYIEPLLTKGKDNTTHSRRVVFSYLQNNGAIKELFDVIGGKIADRPGGYTRIIRLGFREGDGAEMAMIELVDFNDNLQKEAKKSTGRKRRSRRGGGAKKAETTAAAPAETEVAEAPAEETPVTEAPVEETLEETTETAEAPAAEETAEAPIAEAEAPAEEPVAETEAPAAEETSEAEGEAEKKEDEADEEEKKKEE